MKAPSPLLWQRPSPLPQRVIAPCPAAGPNAPRPAPAPPMAGASRPPGRAPASVSPGTAGLQGTVPRGRGKRGAFPDPARTNALPPLPWQGPSPLPQYHAAPRPAGAGAGLCVSRAFWSTGHRPARAGETRVAFPVPAQKGNPCPRISKSVPAAQAGGSVFEQPVGGVPKRGRLHGPLAGKQHTRPQAACATDHAHTSVRQAARMPLAAPCHRISDKRPDAPRADCKSCRAAVPPDTDGPPWSASVR